MARHHLRFGAAPFAPQSIGGDTRGQHRRLSTFGGIEQLRRAFLASLPEIVSEHAACLGKSSRNDGRHTRQGAHHADGLGGLAGKYEGERHVFFYPNAERLRIIAARHDSAPPTANPHAAPYKWASTTIRGAGCPPHCSQANLPLRPTSSIHRSQARVTRCWAVPAAITVCSTPDAPT